MLSPLRIKLHRMLIGSVAAACVGASMLTLTIARADDAAQSHDAAGSVGSPQATPTATNDIHFLIKELDSDVFANREGSAQRLFEAGRAAVEPLAEAARGHSFEQTSAAIGVLRRLMQSGDSDTKTVAQAALEKIAQAHFDTASDLAADALAPPVELPAVIYPRRTPTTSLCNLRARMARPAPVQAAPVIPVPLAPAK